MDIIGASVDFSRTVEICQNPVLGILVFLPRSWIFLNCLAFLSNIFDFLDNIKLLVKILAILLAKKSKIFLIPSNDFGKFCKIWHVLPRIIAMMLAKNHEDLRIFLSRKPRFKMLGIVKLLLCISIGQLSWIKCRLY